MKQAQVTARKPRAGGKHLPMPKAGVTGQEQLEDAPPDEPCAEVRINAVAYALYEARGCVDGHALEDWLTAEQTVTQQDQMAGANVSGVGH
jgi:hypothetical protein